MKVECPICGYTSATELESNTSVPSLIGGSVPRKFKYIHCEKCKEDTCIDSEYDEKFDRAYWMHSARSAHSLIDRINKSGTSNVCIERVLEIPFGTLDRWRLGQVTPEAIALLRIIEKCPGVLEEMDK